MIAVTRLKDFLPFRSEVSTVYLRWRAIMIQIVRMEMVGMMKANEDPVQTQTSLKMRNIMFMLTQNLFAPVLQLCSALLILEQEL